MRELNEHIYAYKKGIRKLILYTAPSTNLPQIEEKLTHQNIAYYVQNVTENKVNVFFGLEECLNVVKSFGDKLSNQYTPEEDFMFGIMLGYDLTEQCKRYLRLKKKK